MPITSVDISYGLFDVTAKPDITSISYNQKAVFADINDLKLESVTPPKAATLEQDYWKLDGSFDLFPDHPENTTWGFWNYRLSYAESTTESGHEYYLFTITPYFYIVFRDAHESSGISLEFNPYDNTYAAKLRIRWYDGDTLLADEYFYPDNWRYTCSKKVSGFNEIIVDFIGMNKPYRYLKVQNIGFGEYITFPPEAVMSADILEEADISSTELAINELSFSVFSKDGNFNVFNPDGVYDLLQKKQKIMVDGYKAELQNGIIASQTFYEFGHFYVDTWDTQEKTVSITAMDALGIMDTTYFDGGMYTNATVLSLVDAVLTDAGFGYSVDDDIGAKTLTGWIPRCTHREALQQIAFAAGAWVDTSRGGMVTVRGDSRQALSILGRNRKFQGSTASLKEYVTEVDLTAHQYTVGAEATEVFRGELPEGLSEVVFSAPAYMVWADIDESTGEVENPHGLEGINCTVLNVITAGTIVLKARPYEDNTTIVRVRVPEIEPGEQEGVVEITDATLICTDHIVTRRQNGQDVYIPVAGNAEAIAQRLLDYYQMRIEQELSFVLAEEVPGGSVNVEVLKDVWREGVVTRLETDLTGGFVTKGVILSE